VTLSKVPISVGMKNPALVSLSSSSSFPWDRFVSPYFRYMIYTPLVRSIAFRKYLRSNTRIHSSRLNWGRLHFTGGGGERSVFHSSQRGLGRLLFLGRVRKPSRYILPPLLPVTIKENGGKINREEPKRGSLYKTRMVGGRG